MKKPWNSKALHEIYKAPRSLLDSHNLGNEVRRLIESLLPRSSLTATARVVNWHL